MQSNIPKIPKPWTVAQRKNFKDTTLAIQMAHDGISKQWLCGTAEFRWLTGFPNRDAINMVTIWDASNTKIIFQHHKIFKDPRGGATDISEFLNYDNVMRDLDHIARLMQIQFPALPGAANLKIIN